MLRLGRTEDRSSRRDDEGSPDRDRRLSRFEVEVVPREPGDLRSTEPGGDEERDERLVVVSSHVLAERVYLLARESLLTSPDSSRTIDEARDVASREPSTDRDLESPVERPIGVRDRRR